MEKNKEEKKIISIVLDKKINDKLEEKKINKSKLINSLLENIKEEDLLKFTK